MYQNPPRNPGNTVTRGTKANPIPRRKHTPPRQQIMQVHKPTFRLEDINTFTALKTARSDNQQCSRALFGAKRTPLQCCSKHCREHFPSRSFVFFRLRGHMKIPKSLSWDTAGSWLDLPGVWIPGASPTCALCCIAISVSTHSTLAMSSNSSSHRLLVSSMVAPIILEIFRLSLELIGPRCLILNHQFSPSHLHFPPPSSLPDDDSVIRLLCLALLLSPSSSSTLLPKRSTLFCNDSKPFQSHSSVGLSHLSFLQLILLHVFLISFPISSPIFSALQMDSFLILPLRTSSHCSRLNPNPFSPMSKSSPLNSPHSSFIHSASLSCHQSSQTF